MSEFEHTKAQRDPTGQGRIVLPAVINDLRQRAIGGWKKYGTPLKTDNGRDALVDAYQEALDLVMYLKQALMERLGDDHDEEDPF